MPRFRAGRRVAVIALVASLAAPALVVTVDVRPVDAARGAVTIYGGAGLSRPVDLAAVDGRVWVVNDGAPLIGEAYDLAWGDNRYRPREVLGYPIDHAPSSVIAGLDGRVWITAEGRIGAFVRQAASPWAPEITWSDGIAGAERLLAGPDGLTWVGCEGTRVCRVDTDLAPVGSAIEVGGRVLDMVSGPDGAVWATTASDGDPTITVMRVPVAGMPAAVATFEGGASAITVGRDANLWLTSDAENAIRRLTPAGVMTTWTGGGIAGPRDIAAGPDGALWFTNADGDTIGRITVAGTLSSYAATGIDEPAGIVMGGGGAMWFTNAAANTLGRIVTNPAVGAFTALFGAGTSNPHGISGNAERVAFANNGTGTADSSIGIMGPSGAVSLLRGASIDRPEGVDATASPVTYTSLGSDTVAGDIGTPAPGTFDDPFGIATYEGPDGPAHWIASLGNDAIFRGGDGSLSAPITHATAISGPRNIARAANGTAWWTNSANDSIGRYTTSATSFTSSTVSDPWDITLGPDGAMWFTNRGNSSIGRITSTGAITRYTHASISDPMGIAAGPDGALWFTNAGNDSIGRITTSGAVTSFTAPFVASPYDIAAGPDGAMWFTNAGNDSIGRIQAVRDSKAPVTTMRKVYPAVATYPGEGTGSKIRTWIGWLGSDTGGSGIDTFELAQRTNDGGWSTIRRTGSQHAYRELTSGSTYRFRARTIDVAGNTGAWVYGPTFAVRRVQDSSSALVYSGRWRTGSSTKYSGGTARYSTTAGASVRYTFTGRAIAWVTAMGPTRGSAKVYIDGKLVTTVSNRWGSGAYQLTRFSRGWSSVGTHTIRIVVSGTSGGARVDVDSFVVFR